ncbi:MAG: hypothetical protein V6Z86_10195 [Hyphomicrobiales bacterium]
MSLIITKMGDTMLKLKSLAGQFANRVLEAIIYGLALSSAVQAGEITSSVGKPPRVYRPLVWP